MAAAQPGRRPLAEDDHEAIERRANMAAETLRTHGMPGETIVVVTEACARRGWAWRYSASRNSASAEPRMGSLAVRLLSGTRRHASRLAHGPCVTYLSTSRHIEPAQQGICMDPQDNKQLALHKAISSHEQAAAGLADLIGVLPDERYEAMLSRIKQNLAELHADMERSKPEDRV